MTDHDLKNLCLIEIEKLLHYNGKCFKVFGSIPYPNVHDVRLYDNKLTKELNYDSSKLVETYSKLI